MPPAAESPTLPDHPRFVARHDGAPGEDKRGHRAAAIAPPDAWTGGLALTSGAADDEVGGLIEQFQHVMQRFLQTQETVMRDLVTAFAGAPMSAPAGPPVAPAPT